MAMRNPLRLLFTLVFLLCQVACQPYPAFIPPPDWTFADLRALDPADDIPASQDLIALYLRRIGGNIEIRLDFLDLSTRLDCDLTLGIDVSPHGGQITIKIPASGELSARNESGQPVRDLQPRVTRDTFLDTVVISLKRSSLMHSELPFQVQAYTTPAGLSTIRDRIGPVRSDAPPPGRANILLAFWDTFQSATPAQALRAWNGAHSGPGRSRHGLHDLLNAVKSNAVPVFLLDTKTPETLSALDYMGALPEIKNLADLRIVILPDVSRYEIPINPPVSVTDTHRFGLPESPFLYTTDFTGQPGGSHRVIFYPSISLGQTPLQSYAYRWQSLTIIPVPDGKDTLATYSPTPDGPSLELRRALIQSTLEPQAGIFFLGGKFADTAWGDPASVSPTFHYLIKHPWAYFLTGDDILTLQPASTPPPSPAAPQVISRLEGLILQELQNAPPGTITDLAWEMYFSLLTPATPELTELRAGYFGIIGHLLVAARWAARPGTVTDCNEDIDWDGQAECILVSPGFFATLEPSSGNVVVAFARKADGVHQIIAPYAQFVVGLGDPSTWNPDQGSAGDPGLVPGGFVDPLGPWTSEAQPGQITFIATNGTAHKIYHLTETGLQVEYQTSQPVQTQISLGLDPWLRFTNGWGNAYQENTFQNGWGWQLGTELQVTIVSSGAITAHPFTASRPFLSNPEDPNLDYPAGHYIPFPLAWVGITGQDHFYIELSVH